LFHAAVLEAGVRITPGAVIKRLRAPSPGNRQPDGQAAIRQGWMPRDVFNVVTSHGVDSVDAILRLMQAVALGLVALQWIDRNPVQVFELDGGCCING
jgi:hypothetical protein